MKNIFSKYLILPLTLLMGFGLTIMSCDSASEQEESESLQKTNVVTTSSNEETPRTEIAVDEIAGEESVNTQTASGVPVMTFKESEYNFGQINSGEKVSHTFQFTNTGNAPLIISNASASCGCTVPEWPEEPIAPGQQASIQVEFNSSGKRGQQNKTVTINANTTPAITTLRITGMVKEVSNMMGPVRQ